MTSVSLTIHRSAHSIGGNCIELATGDGHRLILDMGRPLDAPREAGGLLPTTLDVTRPVAGVLISHPHLDHYGLLQDLPAAWPVWCGEAAAQLMRMTTGLFGEPMPVHYRSWQHGQVSQVGPFAITPYLTDHSAFDAYMLQIDVAGKRLFYTGDFRVHGRKASLVNRLMANPPPNIDVLLMEGTNLGTDKPTRDETALESLFVALFSETAGRVFVNWSAQNIDRTVTLYRACRKTRRVLVIDLYTADVLETLARFGRIPQPDWQAIKVVVSANLANKYRQEGKGEFVERMAGNGLAVRHLQEHRKRWVIMTRPALVREFQKHGVSPDQQDSWCWSNWSGYLAEPPGLALRAWFAAAGATARHIHTSGHASPADLRAFAMALNPATLVPIHGLAWDADTAGFPPITRLTDGEGYCLGAVPSGR